MRNTTFWTFAPLAILAVSPAQAATRIIYSATSTAVPSYIAQPYAFTQTFGTGGPGGNSYSPIAGEAVTGSSAVRMFTAANQTFMPPGAAGNFLAIRGSISIPGTYTITFPRGMSVVSFLFNTSSRFNFVTLNFQNGQDETQFGGEIFGADSTTRGTGRVTYDFGRSPQLTSIVFGS